MNRVLCTLVLSMAVAAVAAPTASAKTLVVDDDNGCADKQYSTIQSALDATSVGDTVKVCPGVYVEHVMVFTDKVKLMSRVRHAAVIVPPNAEEAVTNFRSQVLIRGFTIRGDVARVECRNAVEQLGTGTVDYNRIEDFACNDPSESGGLAVYAENVNDGVGGTTIAGNEITNVRVGVVARGFVRVQNNHIRLDSGADFGVGIACGSFCQDLRILSNVVEGSAGAGIAADAFERSFWNVRISGNTVRNNATGIVTGGLGIGIGEGNPTLRVDRNRVFDNAGDGIVHDGSGPAAYFKNNTALGNGGFDCVDSGGTFSAATWKGNVGVTDSPFNICRPPV